MMTISRMSDPKDPHECIEGVKMTCNCIKWFSSKEHKAIFKFGLMKLNNFTTQKRSSHVHLFNL